MNEKSITTITLKKINKKSVYQYIYEHRQTAKQQIVQDLTMGLSTVSQRNARAYLHRPGRAGVLLRFFLLKSFCSRNFNF